MTQQKSQLHKTLWDIANTLRGNMGADEFRDYILGFIFYKYLSEKTLVYANSLLLSEGKDYKSLKSDPNDPYIKAIKTEALSSLGYFLLPDQLFSSVVEEIKSKDAFIIDKLPKIFNSIEQSTASEEDFGGLFEEIDLTSSKLGRLPENRNKLISKVMVHLSDIDFELENSEIDILGDAYEYLISQFASGAGKKAGEFYTPQQVSTILARIVTLGKNELSSVYDPTCGSGSLLLRVAKEVNRVGGFYGQELNRTTYNLARMNMILHDVHYQKFDLRQADTLEDPLHEGQVFEAIVANPPFSAKWSADPLKLNDPRYSIYGKLAPKTKADYAFVTHMIHHLDDNGTMAVVVPHGVLFRGAAEGHIREFIVKERNWLDTVIGLPANIFFGTPIPTAIMVFKKNRDSDSVLFIDASEGFEKVGNQNVLREQHIDHIVEVYRERKVEDKFSYEASFDKLTENEFNLNIPRYVDTFEEEEPVDLESVSNELEALEGEISETDKTIEEFCKELNIKPPF
tara:strand:+ start:141 stop:1679 length:1539 start_codon:yes stop_codon:yes gene_type:complete